MSESTEVLLEAFRDELQLRLRRTAVVEDLVAREAGGSVTLVARVRVASDTIEITGTGENVLTAFNDLVQSAPEPILGSAFRQVIEA